METTGVLLGLNQLNEAKKKDCSVLFAHNQRKIDMAMKDFHEFVSKLLILWLGCYALILLPGLLKGFFMFVLADFTMPAKHYFDIINTVYTGALWLIPTVFLAVSYYLSRPDRKMTGRKMTEG